jgi:hypothetical protein
MCEVLPHNARETVAALLAAAGYQSDTYAGPGPVATGGARRVGAHAVLRDGRVLRVARRGCR